MVKEILKVTKKCKTELNLYNLNKRNKQKYVQWGNAITLIQYNPNAKLLEDKRMRGKNKYFNYMQKQRHFDVSNICSVDMAKKCEAGREIMRVARRLQGMSMEWIP